MAKKKVNIEIPRSGAAAEVPSGDVNIVYNDVRIAGLSETVDATLKTGGTVVQHDIEVEYTKPSGGLTFPEISFDIEGENIDYAIYNGSPFFQIINNEGVKATYTQATNYVPRKVGTDYQYQFNMVNIRDNLAITVNGQSVPFSTDEPAGYSKNIIFNLTPGNVTVVIRDKT